MITPKLVATVFGLCLSTATIAQETASEAGIPPQSLNKALEQFADKSGLQIIYVAELAEGKVTAGARPNLSYAETLDQLLASTGLEYEFLNANTVTLQAVDDEAEDPGNVQTAPRHAMMARAPIMLNNKSREEQGQEQQGSAALKRQDGQIPEVIPEILVVGKRSLNLDIQRTEDDAQPYVIFDRGAIEMSGATTLEDLFKQRLTMNAVGQTNEQLPSNSGVSSQINLRGLGTNQTLILIDGRPAPAISAVTGLLQPEVKGIPLAAVERIEVLPATASGIYGGGATGGVINIVLRRDYSGVELQGTYENTFESDAPIRRLDVNAGFPLEHGRTNVLLAASWSDTKDLLQQDRDFVQRGRNATIVNNPAGFLPPNAPPLSATTNIRSADGSPLFGPGTPNFTSVPIGYAGGGGLAPLQVNAGRYNLGLADTAQQQGAKRSILNSPRVTSVMATINREFTPHLRAFLELSGSDNHGSFRTNNLSGTYVLAADAPNNPFGQSVIVTAPIDSADSSIETINRNRRGVGGVILKLPADWMAEASYTWNRADWSYALAPFGGPEASAIADGTLDVLRDLSAFPIDVSPLLPGRQQSESPFRSTLSHVTVSFGGPTKSLPGGPIMLNGRLEHRDERFDETTINAGDTPTAIKPSRSQNVVSGYVEARIPVASALNRHPGIEMLELQIAARGDRYTVNGSTGLILAGAPAPVDRTTNKDSSVNPTIAVRYQPVRDLVLRASYGTGFLPPDPNQLVPQPVTTAPGGFFTDPRRGNADTGPFQFVGGGNPGLEPEKSESWSAGMVVTPRHFPALRMSLDYVRIRKTGNITQLPVQTLIDNADLFPDRVVRGPAAPGDPFDVGPISFVDGTAINIARAELQAVDIAFDIHKETESWGTLGLHVLATKTTDYETQVIASSPVVENVGAGFNFPLSLKGSAGVSWKFHSWTFGWSARYLDSYRLTNAAQALNQGSTSVRSQIYNDAFVSYQLNGDSGLSETEIRLGVKNVFNEEPPLDMSNAFGFYSPFGDPRLASYSLSVKHLF